MGLRLQTVAARQGLSWVREGLAGFLRWPLAYSLLFVMFMVVISLMSLLPPLLSVPLVLMGSPLLGLGFTMAAHDAARGQAPHPRAFLAAWRGQPRQVQRSQLLLCMAFAVGAALVMAAGPWLGADRFFEVMDTLSRGQAGPDEAERLLSQEGLAGPVLALMALFSLLSLVFWHAPALVVWGSQGPGQALFSSVLALWRTRGAFLYYSLGWTAVVCGAGLLAGLLLPLLGQVMGLLMMPLATALAAAFYVSLYPCYRDTFGAPQAAGQDPLARA